MKLSDTVLAGYSDNFPVVQAKLPLKYFSTTTQSSTSSVSSSSSSSFQLNLANKGSIIPLNDIDGTVIDSVSYTLLNDLKTIRLTPLITQINRLSLKFQQIEILLPHKVSSSSCFSVYLNKDQDDSYLLVDIIDENYLFISIKVMLNDFVRNIDGKNKISQKSFQLDKFDQWGNISVPYSFELRSLPYLIRAISSKDLIVSLKDGGLLHFNRSDPLSDYQVYNFNEPTRILPFKIIESIWKKAENSQISNNSVSDKLGDVSVSSLVDLTLLTPTTFITLSINKILKIWDLTTHRLSSPPIDLKSSTSDPSLWLTASSIVKYLQVVHNGDQKYLSCHYYDSRKDQYDEGEGNVVFKLWEIIPIAEQSIELADITRHQFNPKLPNSKSSGAVWFIQDFFVTIANDIITYSILWKTNTSTIVSINNLDFINGTVTSVEWLNKSVNRSVLSTFSPYFDSNYYSDKILNSGYYNDLIVKTSLNIFRNHIGFNKDHDLSLTNLSLRQSILETIRCGEDGATERLNWYKLDSLCEEYKKLSEECLSMLPSTNVIHILNANSMCLVRQSHELETFASTFSTNQLASILNELSIIISTKTYIKIYDQILDASVALTSEKVGEIYQTFLSSKISKEDSEALIEKLINIPNILDQFNELIDLTPNQLQAEFGTIFNSDSIGGLTKLSSILSFKDIKRSHESILLGLTVLLLIMEVNDPILGLINKLSARLARYKLLNTVFDTSYSIATSSGNSNIGSFSGKVERNNISNLENSLFWQGVVSNYSVLGERINQGDLNSAYDILYSIIINDYENFITNIIIELINHDEGDLIKEIFIKNLKQDDAIDTFLIGFVYLISNDSVEFYKVFELDVFDFKDKQVKQDIKKKIFKSLNMNVNIKTFLNSIFSEISDIETDPALEKANYYHSLSVLATSQSKVNTAHSRFITPINSTFLITEESSPRLSEASNSSTSFLNCALKFELKAVEALQFIKSPNAFVEEKLLSFNHNLFEMALNLNDYDLVYKSLEYLDEHSLEEEKRVFFTKLINNLISSRSISLIFKGKNDLFRRNYILIDVILLGLANNELVLSHSLKFYEYLYSWRLFGASDGSSFAVADKRGAIQSLYIFITRFRQEHKYLLSDGKDGVVQVDEDIKQYKLKVLELYMIILNCLKSFDNKDDQWIVKISENVESMDVITLDELTKEYLEWLKELQSDMSEWV